MPKTKTTKPTVKKTVCCVNCDPHTHPLNKVTSVSKVLAAVLFVTLPFVFFLIGANFQRSIDLELCSTLAEYSVTFPF
jgi:hypothetical protein